MSTKAEMLKRAPRKTGHYVRRPALRQAGGIYLFVAPALLFVAVFLFYPLVYSLVLTFTKYNFVFDQSPVFVGLQNIRNLFRDAVFLEALGNTLLFAAIFFVLIMTVSLGIALLIESRLRGMLLVRTFVFLPVLVALALSGVVFTWILNPSFGILNHLLREVGLPQFASNWLSDPLLALYSIIAVSVWRYSGIVMIMFLAGLQAIPRELYEAARIDGANGLKQFRFITLPNLRQAFILTGVWSIIQAIKVFEQPFVMTDGGPAHATTTLYLYAWKNAFQFYEMGYASAISYIVAVIIFVFSSLQVALVNRRAE